MPRNTTSQRSVPFGSCFMIHFLRPFVNCVFSGLYSGRSKRVGSDFYLSVSESAVKLQVLPISETKKDIGDVCCDDSEGFQPFPM